MNKIGLYIRVSTDEQARVHEGSLVSQRRRLEEYVQSQNRNQKNWGMIIETYTDEKSGKDLNRPEFQRMMSDVSCGRINVILATELSRFSRSIKDFCELWEFFKEHKTQFITLREQFDTTTAAGEMMVFNLMNFAQFERKQTSERISANWLSRAKRGLWNGGSLPLGYDRSPDKKGTLLINEKEAKEVRRIFDLFLETGSIRKTLRQITKEGIYSKKYKNKAGVEKGGRVFTVSSVYNILKNKAYIGEREINKKKKELKTESVKAVWKPLLLKEKFNKAQKMLEKNKTRYKPDEWKTYAYPLSNKILCGECGKFLAGKSATGSKKKHYYYSHTKGNSLFTETGEKCRLHRLRAGRVEDIVLDFFQNKILNKNTIEQMIKSYEKISKKESPKVQGQLLSIKKELKSLNTRLENLSQRLSEIPSDISVEPIYQQMRKIKEKREKLLESEFYLNEELLKKNHLKVDKEGFFTKLEKTKQALEKSSKEAQREIYHNVLDFVEVHPQKIRVGLFAPSLSLASNGACVRSTNVQLGTRRFKIIEHLKPLTIGRKVKVQWWELKT